MISGIVDFPFDDAGARTAATSLDDIARLCGETNDDQSEILLVRSRAGAGAGVAAAAIHAALPHLHVVTNEELVERFSRVEFSYFRQISVVLATVTLFFGFLLIAVLLTVSVNQRLGRSPRCGHSGFSRWRSWQGADRVRDPGVHWRSLAMPLGATLSLWLDRASCGRCPACPPICAFAFEPRALVLHVVLLAVAALAAAAYHAHRWNAADRRERSAARWYVLTPIVGPRAYRECSRWRPGQSPL